MMVCEPETDFGFKCMRCHHLFSQHPEAKRPFKTVHTFAITVFRATAEQRPEVNKKRMLCTDITD